jgi:3-deoxy-7-phosphoheptulonate synthase
MSSTTALTNWHPASWQARPATQQPVYADADALQRAVASLSRLPPLVVSWEVGIANPTTSPDA